MNITHEEGKRLYSEIGSEARAGNRTGFGSTREAARVVSLRYNVLPQEFDDWWSAVHKIGISSATGDAKTNGKANGKSEAPRDGTIKARYFRLISEQDKVPTDDVLRVAFDCGDATLSSFRSEWRKQGYDFRYVAGDGVYITRPVEQSAEPAEIAPEETPSNDNAFRECEKRLDTIIALLSRLLDAWG